MIIVEPCLQNIGRANAVVGLPTDAVSILKIWSSILQICDETRTSLWEMCKYTAQIARKYDMYNASFTFLIYALAIKPTDVGDVFTQWIRIKSDIADTDSLNVSPL